MTVLRAATRGSPLALWQTHHVAKLIEALHPDVTVEPIVVSTAGDRDKTTPLHVIGGKGVFVKEVQAAVLDGRADFAVHSAKDLPALTPEGLTIAGVPERADRSDALVGSSLALLKQGARVGTGSARRHVQLKAARPDIEVVEIRGNIDTRLGLVGELDAIVMASAALDRLGRTPDSVERLDVDVMIPQVGQGTLAIEAAVSNDRVCGLLDGLDHVNSRRELEAERSFLAELGGDCDLPAGATSFVDADGQMVVRAMLWEGGELARGEVTDRDGVAAGRELAKLLREQLA